MKYEFQQIYAHINALYHLKNAPKQLNYATIYTRFPKYHVSPQLMHPNYINMNVVFYSNNATEKQNNSIMQTYSSPLFISEDCGYCRKKQHVQTKILCTIH